MKPQRCAWAGTDPRMIAYHDKEWGVPVHDDRLLFEFLTLEGAQAGLSWQTILNKRDAYREAFAGFEHPLRDRVVARRGRRYHHPVDLGVLRDVVDLGVCARVRVLGGGRGEVLGIGVTQRDEPASIVSSPPLRALTRTGSRESSVMEWPSGDNRGEERLHETTTLRVGRH